MRRSALAPALVPHRRPRRRLRRACRLRPDRDATAAGDPRAQGAGRSSCSAKAAVHEVELARLRQQVAELEAPAGGRRGEPAAAASGPPRHRPRPPRRRRAPTARAGRSRAPRVDAGPAPAERRSATEPAARSRPQPAPRRQFEESDLEVRGRRPAPRPRRPRRRRSRAAPPRRPPRRTRRARRPPRQALYDRGYTLYHQGHYVDAEASFQRFLQGSPASELADNAQYWIGECRYARGDHARRPRRLPRDRRALPRGQQGARRPAQGRAVAWRRWATVEGARVTYREVVRRFPGTAAAAVAEERRAKLPLGAGKPGRATAKRSSSST